MTLRSARDKHKISTLMVFTLFCRLSIFLFFSFYSLHLYCWRCSFIIPEKAFTMPTVSPVFNLRSRPSSLKLVMNKKTSFKMFYWSWLNHIISPLFLTPLHKPPSHLWDENPELTLTFGDVSIQRATTRVWCCTFWKVERAVLRRKV